MNEKPRKSLICLLIVGLLLSGCRSGSSPEPTLTPTLLEPTLTPALPGALTIPGLVLYYPFNGNASDLSGNQNNGQVYGATLTMDRFGISNHAYYFDGIDDTIAFDASKMPLGNSPRTISAWVKVESFPPELFSGLGSRATVIGWGLDDYKQLSEMQIVNGRLQFHNYSTDNTSAVGLELNRWYHLAIVYEDGAIDLYVNGKRDSQEAASISTVAGSGRIGAYPDPKSHGFDSSYFHGTIDDISVYNRALSESQIQALYMEGGWGK